MQGNDIAAYLKEYYQYYYNNKRTEREVTEIIR